jgi:hypothetical protein
MSIIDRQRVAAVRTMEALGYTFDGQDWNAPSISGVPAPTIDEADAMHGLLVSRADKLEGYGEGSEDEVEYQKIAKTIEAYEAKRWPDGRVPRGSG